MKYYGAIISLGQYCITATALRRLHLVNYSLPFDWSAGIIEELCGKGGLEGKVNLICNDFKNFFNFEDFENRGNNQENDTYNLWVVNRRTGLQYKHDFPAEKNFEESFLDVQKKYNRRVKRLYKFINKFDSICFLYIARDINFSEKYLCEQQAKLARKFPNKTIDFIYLLHDKNLEFSSSVFYKKKLNKNVVCFYLNLIHSRESYPESWNGNTKLYYPILCQHLITFSRIKYLIPVTFNMARCGILWCLFIFVKKKKKHYSGKISFLMSKLTGKAY